MGKSHDLKMFTLEEANRLLPQLEKWIEALQAGRAAILALEAEIDALELVSEKNASGFSPAVNRKMEEHTRLMEQFSTLVGNFDKAGCLLKDLDTGLVDFYSLQNNHVVFLCWKQGEPGIAYWHEIGGGYASRQSFSK